MEFEKIEKAVEQASEKIKSIIFSEEMGAFLKNLGGESGLSDEATMALTDEVGYIILGLKERASLKESLQRIGISKPTVFSIIQEINKKIFKELDEISPKKPEEDNRLKPEKLQISEPTNNNLPMIEVGEVVHGVKQQTEMPNITPTPKLAQTPAPTSVPQPVKPLEERKASVSVPQSSYKPGQDPYREPIG